MWTSLSPYFGGLGLVTPINRTLNATAETTDFQHWSSCLKMFQRDHTSVHKARMTENLAFISSLPEFVVEKPDWPAQSPDLNPVQPELVARRHWSTSLTLVWLIGCKSLQVPTGNSGGCYSSRLLIRLLELGDRQQHLGAHIRPVLHSRDHRLLAMQRLWEFSSASRLCITSVTMRDGKEEQRHLHHTFLS